MRGSAYLVITVLSLSSFLLMACSPMAPTTVPTQPSVPATPTSAAPPPPSGATSAPAAATKPAAAAPTATPAAQIKRGGIVRTSYNADWATADPHLDQYNRFERGAAYEGLMNAAMNEKTKRFELIPELAATWELADPKTLVFRLQKGVKFHDGSDWNAQVAKWNLERMRDHPKSLTKENVVNIESIEAVDDYTLRLKLKQPSASGLWLLSSPAGTRVVMASKAAFDKNGEEWLSTHMSGTGPFELSEYRQGDRQIFKKFANYWRKGVDGQPMPYLDGLEVRWIQDSTVQMVELRSGQLQFQVEIQPRDLPAVKSNPDLVLSELPWDGRLNLIGLNQQSGPFKDNLKLRQAVQYAIDRESMAKTLGMSAGIAGKYAIGEGQVGYSESIPQYKFDLEKAKSLVKEAGFPNGMDFTLVIIARQPDLPQSEVIKSMLEKVGIRATIDPMERLANLAKLRSKNFDASTYGAMFQVDPYVTLYTRFSCTTPGDNWAWWCNPKFDECLQESELATNDEKRGEIFQRCYKIVHDEAHYVHLWTLQRYDAYSKKLKGVKPYFRSVNFWHELWME